MAKVEFARDKLRSRFSNLLDEFEAMLIFLAKMNSSAKKQIEAERNNLALANKRELQNGLKELSARVGKLRRTTGVTQPIGYYSTALKSHPADDGLVYTLPNYMAVALFNKYPRVAKALENNELPVHALIELDFRGLYERQDTLQFRMLEAMLFEDLCFFWNESCLIQERDDPYSQKHELKRLAAFHRAAVSSAFYMVEAFCNGIALEVFLTRRDELSDRERQMITEWDSKLSRPKFLSLRDKLLQYPKLLLSATAPPVQESHSPELAYFLSSAKELRDSIVHANPSLSSGKLGFAKLQTFQQLDHVQCGKVIDCSIAVVDQIATAIDRRKSVFWLQTRRKDELFDESVFD